MAKPHAKWFGGQLTALREARRMSQAELARRSGVSRQGLGHLEAGTREPSWETVQRLAAALGVGYADLAYPTLDLPAAPAPTPRPKRGKPKKGGQT
jgi:transcriptional regulator with XRE-family HTH domain